MQGLERKVSLHKHQAWEGLNKICSLHSFRKGDKIIFECHMMMPSSDIRVLLLMTSYYKRHENMNK